MDFRVQRTWAYGRQYRLAGVSRSGWYYEAEPGAARNLRLMRLMDRRCTRTPFYGIRRMGWWLGERRIRGQRKTGTPADAADGAGSDLSEATAVVSLFTGARSTPLCSAA